MNGCLNRSLEVLKQQEKNPIVFFLYLNNFLLEFENIDDDGNPLFVGLVGLVNWLSGKEDFWASPRVCGIRLFNDISTFPCTDDQVF